MKKILSRSADTAGTGAETALATGNYAAAPTEFKVTAQANERIFVHRMIVSLVDGAIVNADVYAGAGVLTNGIKVYVTDRLGAIQYSLTDPAHAIKDVGGWAHYCHDLTIWAGLGAGDDHATVRWTFAKSGVPVELLPGWSLNVLCQDNLSALTEHRFLMQGYFDANTSLSGDAGHA